MEDMEKVVAVAIEKTETGAVLVIDGTKSEELAVTKDGKSYCLPENPTGRQWFALSKLEKLAVGDQIEVTARNIGAPRTPGEKKTPGAWMQNFLPEEVWQEYLAIIDRATQAKLAAVKQPMSDVDKAKIKAEKAKAKYEALLAELAEKEGN